jgi:hypothetical protein
VAEVEYIIEHPTRGILMDQETSDGIHFRTRWAWSKPRTQAKTFNSLFAARIARQSIEPEITRTTSQIMIRTEDGDWVEVKNK